ncbi:GDP-L-fucose synthase family protein [Lacimicrobium alkaliphilum]|uniref:GDP-L-fucose synthase n=1 Tax=Lacimicrobium alkaliphilum TaxID=1526571 RepID=A0ABQ1RP35_9ALTE|nr:GDP-L-fucose synthase [Lacimicrobium alkaliphilum]GGD76714.1 GDP-L-fucose synthase [Lacimicrobium alkaliphilum]
MDTKRIFVAGHQGLVGRALVRQLQSGNDELILKERDELDLTDQHAVSDFFASEGIDQVYLAAAKVGGILANSQYPADFIYQNLQIACNVIHASHLAGVPQLLFLGSSCIYPRDATQPITEEALLTGKLESTNAPYAIAKIAGIKLCESYHIQYGRDYRSVMPTNLYGPFDNFHPQHSHVIPGLIQRFEQAKRQRAPQVTIWGSGRPQREFLYVDDMGDACIHLMQLAEADFWASADANISHINIGSGEEISIAALAELLAEVTAYQGEITFDTTKPDGTPRKRLDNSRLFATGWRPETNLKKGLEQTYQWYLAQNDKKDYPNSE